MSCAPIAGSVICAGVYGAAGTPSSAARLLYRLTRPGPDRHPLGRDVVETRAHQVENGAFALGRRRHRRMPALAGQRDPSRIVPGPIGTSPEAPSPEPGPSTADRPASDRRAAADRHPVALAEQRQRQRHRGEIVDRDEPLETEPVAQSPRSKSSKDGWSSDPVAGDRGRDRHRAETRHRQIASRVEIGPDRVVDRRRNHREA